jgi:2',3'-cyclic-nucleotide 2'-phosphodiesterase (5'-nucleotidase family)
MANSVPDEQMEAAKAKAELILDSYGKLGTQGVAVGDRDLSAFGVEQVKAWGEKYKTPFLCANLVDKDEKPVFKPYAVVEAAGYKLGIFGLITGGAEFKEKESYKLLPAADTAVKVLKDLEAEKVDAVILLAHLDRRDAQEIVDKAPGIGLVLGGQGMGMSSALEPLQKAWWSEGGQRGKFLYVVTLNMSKPGPQQFVVREEGQKLTQELADLDSRIMRYAKMGNQPARDGTRTANPERYKGIVESMMKQRETLAERATKLAAVSAEAPFISFLSVALNRDLREDADMAKAVQEFETAHPAASGGHGHAALPRPGTGLADPRPIRKLNPEIIRSVRDAQKKGATTLPAATGTAKP